MAALPPQIASGPLILTYQGKDTSLNLLNGKQLMNCFRLAMMMGACATMLLACVLENWNLLAMNGQQAVWQGVVGLAGVVPATIGLSLAVRVRQDVCSRVQYRGAMGVLLWGAIAGGGSVLLVAHVWMWLIYNLLFPLAAGVCLTLKNEAMEAEPALKAAFRRHLAIGAGVLVFFIAGGYASAWMSKGICERQVARHLAKHEMMGRPFRHLADDEESARVFRSIGIETLPGDDYHFYPWARVRDARIECPFVVSLQYAWVGAPLEGQGGHKRFVCIFGFVIEFKDEGEWVT
jgi:hypothetical protein